MNALATIDRGTSPALSGPEFGTPDLAVFRRVPHRHGVAVLRGMVVVYDPDAVRWDGLEAGGYYVVEYQRPRSGMTEEMRLRLGSPLQTEREVVRLFQIDRDSVRDLWWLRHSGSTFVSGPMQDFNLADMIVGKVVGIYVPERPD
jgi:hypothetical protein